MFRHNSRNSLIGLTLIEVLLAGALSALLIGCVYTLYWKAHKHARNMELRARHDQLAYLMLDRVTRDLEQTKASGCLTESDSLWIRLLDRPGPNGTPWKQLVGYHLNGQGVLVRILDDQTWPGDAPFPEISDLEKLWTKRPSNSIGDIASFKTTLTEHEVLVEFTSTTTTKAYQRRQAFSL